MKFVIAHIHLMMKQFQIAAISDVLHEKLIYGVKGDGYLLILDP